MCVSSPKPPRDNSAEIARQQEAERQARIAQGQSTIDQEFGNFNDDFFNTYQQDYMGYYSPQLEDQYGDARKRLTLQLAKTGNLTSSAGANQLRDLTEYYNTQNTGITNQALDAVNTLRGNIDQRKSQLYADNRAAADPGNAAAAAQAAAVALKPTPPSSPLANTFADFFNNLGNSVAIYNQTRPYQQGQGVQTFGGSNAGSAQVIGNEYR
jgi:hypothetical protein